MRSILSLICLVLCLFSCKETNQTNDKVTVSQSDIDPVELAERRKQDAQLLRQERINEKMKIDIPDYIDLNYVTGRFDPSSHEMMSKIDSRYANRDNLYMHKDAYKAFKGLHTSAKSAGVDLVIKSAARNFDYQGAIWGRKWRGETKLESQINAATDIDNDLDRVKEIMKYSSMPGTSRHHWGTDIDLNNFTNEYFEKGKGKAEYDWLRNNANKFGFFQSYTDKQSGRTGYEEEKWHWSYMPVAVYCQELIKKELVNKDIVGFPGYEQVGNLDVKNNYIFGLDNFCLFYGTN